MTIKVYNLVGQHKLMTRVQTRRQLEQWHECWSILAQSEQYADEYEQQHWVSRRQELQAPPEDSFTNFWLQEWWSTKVITSVHDDLPFVLSQPVGSMLSRLNMTAGSEYLLDCGLSLLAFGTAARG
jgi:hypothetical protein